MHCLVHLCKKKIKKVKKRKHIITGGLWSMMMMMAIWWGRQIKIIISIIYSLLLGLGSRSPVWWKWWGMGLMFSNFMWRNCAPRSLIYQLFSISPLISDNGKKQGWYIIHIGTPLCWFPCFIGWAHMKFLTRERSAFDGNILIKKLSTLCGLSISPHFLLPGSVCWFFYRLLLLLLLKGRSHLSAYSPSKVLHKKRICADCNPKTSEWGKEDRENWVYIEYGIEDMSKQDHNCKLEARISPYVTLAYHGRSY